MEEVKRLIQSELTAFDGKFKEVVKSKVPLLDRVMHYLVKHKGKQIRPMFVFLSARLVGEASEATYRAAALVELLHTATLVHDDVVDEANKRRGSFSINALWKNKTAVLVGDYLLSKGLLLSLDNGDFRILQLLSSAVKQMSEGELLQIEKTRKLNIEETTYFDIINGKTASLLASACAAGAYSSSEDEEIADKLYAFGQKVGIAFQIKDDLFDYSQQKIGKPTGNDLREKKITLPLIYTLKKVDRKTKRHLINIVKNQSHKKSKIQEVIECVKNNGGLDYAEEQMYKYQKEAFEVLHSFPDSEIRQGLEKLVRFTTERTY